MGRSAKECYKELVAALCKNYGEYVYELRREHKTEEDSKRVFEALKSAANAESALELFWLASNERGLRIALQAMTEGFDKKDIKTVSKEIDDIIRRREELELPPETYRGE